MTPTQIKSALMVIGAKANKKLGQHFLIDQQALATIVSAADIKHDDRILEVGPGLGVLTRALIGAGASVIAIEKDRKFVTYLEFNGLDLHLGDAAKIDWEPLIKNRPWKFVSNLPYAITSLALRKSLYINNSPELVVVLVQREVAERALARDGKQSLLSLMVALASSKTEIVRRVPPGAFYPPPKVESAVLKIVPMTNKQRLEKWGIEPEEVMAVAKKGFAHPRKLLQRNLAIESNKWQELSSRIGFNIKARPEDLSAQQWVELAKFLYKQKSLL